MITNIFIAGAALAQDVGLDAPQINMDTPAVKTDMPGQGGGMAQDRDRLLVEKNIKDIERARSELAAMSEWQAPATASNKERKEWQQQSRRLARHAGTLEDISSRLSDLVERASRDSADVDYQQATNRAREVISSLQNEINTSNIKGDAAAKRQQAAANSLNSLSLL